MARLTIPADLYRVPYPITDNITRINKILSKIQIIHNSKLSSLNTLSPETKLAKLIKRTYKTTKQINPITSFPVNLFLLTEIKIPITANIIDIREITIQGYGRIDVLKAINLNNKPAIAEIETGAIIEVIENSSKLINIIGTASGENFERYALYYGLGENPIEWIELVSSNNQIENDVLYSNFNTSLLERGDNYLRLVVWNTFGEATEDRNILNIYIIDPNLRQITMSRQSKLNHQFLGTG